MLKTFFFHNLSERGFENVLIEIAHHKTTTLESIQFVFQRNHVFCEKVNFVRLLIVKWKKYDIGLTCFLVYIQCCFKVFIY